MKKVEVILFVTIMSVATIGCEELDVMEPGNLVAKTVVEDLSLPAININQAKLHSESFGTPEKGLIVVVHGGPGGDYRYLLHCKDLVEYGYQVVFYDQRGSGLSERFPKVSYTSMGAGAVDLMYEELGSVIAHYKTSPDQNVYLIGHSWGAMLATGYTGKHPNEIQGLVLCEPGGLKWDDVYQYVSTSNSFSLWGELLNDATYMDQFITGKEDQHEILDYKMALRVSNNDITGEYNTEPGSIWRSGAVINMSLLEIGKKYRPDFSAGIANFQIPVLFFNSEYNKAYQNDWADRISAAFNAVERCQVPGTGHNGIISDAKAWNETTLPRIITYFNSL